MIKSNRVRVVAFKRANGIVTLRYAYKDDKIRGCYTYVCYRNGIEVRRSVSHPELDIVAAFDSFIAQSYSKPIRDMLFV